MIREKIFFFGKMPVIELILSHFYMYNSYILFLAFPALTGYLVGKADMRKEGGRLGWTKILSLNLVCNLTYSAIVIYTQEPVSGTLSTVLNIITLLVFVFVESCVINMNLVMISIVAAAIEDEVAEVQEEDQFQILMSNSKSALKKFQQTKTGLSPLLSLMIIGLAVNLLITSYTLFTQFEVNSLHYE